MSADLIARLCSLADNEAHQQAAEMMAEAADALATERARVVEECAKMADDLKYGSLWASAPAYADASRQIAAAIRALIPTTTGASASTSTASGPGAPTIEWSDKELTALRECMEFQQLSERAVLRQALANYQIICRREHGLETEVPGPLKAESPYGERCRNPKACTGKGYCPLDPTCGD